MTISVVIATYNRARLLADCLDRLARQHFEGGDEVIVVDNGSTDRTPDVIRDARATFPTVLQHLEEAQPGKCKALARALHVARGEIVAFTDDDVEVDDGWLSAIRSAMRDPSTALVGGPVRPRWERAAPAWLDTEDVTYSRLLAPLALLNYGDQAVPLGSFTLLGANLAARRDVLNQVGGFAGDLGKIRGTLLSGEDHELCERVRRFGFRALYCPAVRVTHWVPRDRMRLRYFVAWFFWSGITHAMLESSRGSSSPSEPRPRSLGGVPLYLVKRFAAGLGGAALALVRGRRLAAVDSITQAAFAAGYAARRWRVFVPHAAAHPPATRRAA